MKDYLIVCTPDKNLRVYNDLDFVKKNKDSLDKLRQQASFIDYKSYRGIGREQLTSHPYYPVGQGGQIEELEEKEAWDNLSARKKIAEFEYSQEREEFSFINFKNAEQAYNLIDNKVDFEIIEVSSEKENSEKTLGFDIGTWWSSYSIIADTFVIPMWHPPNFDNFDDILEIARRLNKHCLFDKYDDAGKFLQTYLTKDWGEKEMTPGQFKICQISAV